MDKKDDEEKDKMGDMEAAEGGMLEQRSASSRLNRSTLSKRSVSRKSNSSKSKSIKSVKSNNQMSKAAPPVSN